MKGSMKRAAAVLVLAAIATALSASVALAGSFSISPPGHGGTTATCVGPQFDPENPDFKQWTAHFVQDGLKNVVNHDLACD